MSEEQPFQGFSIPIPGSAFLKTPYDWEEECIEIDNLAELRIVKYVMRHTWGFHEYDGLKKISVDEFMHGRKRTDGTRMDKGTGLKSDRSVKDGINRALEHGYIVVEVDKTDMARIKKFYGLNINSRQVDSTPLRQVDSTPLRQVDSTPGQVDSTPRRVDNTYRSEKDTLERNFKKEIESLSTQSAKNKNGNAHANASADNDSHFSSKTKTTKATPPPVTGDKASPRSGAPQVEKSSRSKISLSSAGENFLAAWDKASVCPANRSDREVVKAANYLGPLMETIPPWHIMRTRQRMEKQKFWVEAGGVSLAMFAKHFQAQYGLFMKDLNAGAVLEPLDIETRDAEREALCTAEAPVEDEHAEDMRMLNLLPETHHVFKMRSELYLKKYGRPYVRPSELEQKFLVTTPS